MWAKCSSCGCDDWSWQYRGWDKISIDENLCYHRQYKGEEFESEITCSQCEKEFNDEEDLVEES